MKNKVRLFVALSFIVIFFNGCNNNSDYKLMKTQKDISVNKITSKQTIDYRILPHDRLQVTLYRNPEFVTSSTFGSLGEEMQEKGLLVNTNGDIFLPLINKVHVAGLTQTQAAESITSLYAKYLKIPTAYVEVLNKRIYVLGEVRKPGPVEVDRESLTLLEVLAHAGDLTDSAVRDNVIIVSRLSNGLMSMRSVDLTKFDTMSLYNIILQPNDIVYVQPDGWKEFKVASDNLTTPFVTISQVASPFVTLKYLSD